MVSYADMITILMAFFVVMFSMAGQKDNKREEPIMSALRKQFGRYVGMTNNQLLLNGAGAVPGGGPRINNPAKEAKNPGLAGDHLRVMTVRQGDQATIGGVLQFAPDAVELSEKQRLQLQGIAQDLGGKPQKIEIRGHTVNRPPPTATNATDNWDLAYQRCHKVMQYLISAGIDPRRIRLGVAAQYEPVYVGREQQEMERNSRVEVFILNEFSQNLSDDETDKPAKPPAK